MTDFLQVVLENIEVGDNGALTKLTQYYVKEGNNKHAFMVFLIKTFAERYVNKNLWVLKEITKLVGLVEGTTPKMKAETAESLADACLLLAALPPKVIQCHGDARRVERILHGFSGHRFPVLEELQDHLTYSVFCLLNCLYENMSVPCNMSDSLIISRHILGLKKKELFEMGRAHPTLTDAYDVMFYVILTFTQNTKRLAEDVIEYVAACKDLFYYRCKQKDRPDRVNLLLYALFVIINGRVSFQTIDYKPESCVLKKTDYLFVWVTYNEELSAQINKDKAMKLAIETPEKTVITEDLPGHRQGIDVVRVAGI